MSESFVIAAFVAPAMLLIAAGIVYFIATRSDANESRMARSGEENRGR